MREGHARLAGLARPPQRGLASPQDSPLPPPPRLRAHRLRAPGHLIKTWGTHIGPTFRSLRNVIFDYFERRLINPGFAEAHDECCSCPSIAALLIYCQGSSIWAIPTATLLCSLSSELAWVLRASPSDPQNNQNLSKLKLRNVGLALTSGRKLRRVIKLW
jgi:hypothetical protein